MTMNMAPPTTAAAQPSAQMDMTPPELTKALEMTMQGLSKAYMICHKMDPDGALCNAVMSVQKAVAEVASNAGMPSDPGMDPAAMGEDPTAGDPSMMGPETDPMMEDQGPPPEDSEPMPPGSSIADAAGETQSMMQDAAKRRQAKG